MIEPYVVEVTTKVVRGIVRTVRLEANCLH